MSTNASRLLCIWSSDSSPARAHRHRTTSSSTFGPRSGTLVVPGTPPCTASHHVWRPSAWSPRRVRAKADAGAFSRSCRRACPREAPGLDRPSGAPTELRDPGLPPALLRRPGVRRGSTPSRPAAARSFTRRSSRPTARMSVRNGVRIDHNEASGRSKHWRGRDPSDGPAVRERGGRFLDRRRREGGSVAGTKPARADGVR